MPSISLHTLIAALVVTLLSGVAITAIALSPALGNGSETPTSFSGSSAGAVVGSTNSGNGAAIEGSSGTVGGGQAVIGVGTGGLNSNTTSSLGVEGKVYGPSSTAVLGQSLSTDSAHPSIGVVGSSSSGNGMYAKTTVPSPALFAYNLSSSTAGIGIQAQSTGNAVVGSSIQRTGVLGITRYKAGSILTAKAGISGEDLGTNNFGVAGSTLTGYGVYGNAAGTGIGVVGTSANSAGVSGQSTNNNGVVGISTYGAGIIGQTGSGIPANGAAGIQGADLSNGGTSNSGIQGISSLGSGVLGVTDSGFGITGEALMTSGTGVRGSACCGGGVGVKGIGTYGVGVFAQSNGAQPALKIYDDRNPPSGTLVVAKTVTSDVMSLDYQGNAIFKGMVTASGTPLLVTRTAAAGALVTYSARQSQPTMEDFGEAQLTGGQAFVRLDRAFVDAIDRRATYLVFLTPLGEPRGMLYVAQRSPDGFMVRESGRGQSTLAFDYRIVAKPYDSDAPRLPPVGAVPAIREFYARRGGTERTDRVATRRPSFRPVMRLGAQAFDAGPVPQPPALPRIVERSSRR